MTNSFPSEVEIKEREGQAKKAGDAVLSHVRKPKHTPGSAQPAINPSVGEGSSQLARRPFGALHSIPSQLAVITSWVIIGPTHFPPDTSPFCKQGTTAWADTLPLSVPSRPPRQANLGRSLPRKPSPLPSQEYTALPS